MFPSRFNFLVKPLQRMCVGGFLTAAAFVISGFLELQLQTTYDRIPQPLESHLHVMNGLACPASLRLSAPDGSLSRRFELEERASQVLYELPPGLYDLDVRVGDACREVEGDYIRRYRVDAKEQKVVLRRELRIFMVQKC